MSNSQNSVNNSSPGIKYSNIIATLSLVLWGIVWTNLSCLGDRMRGIELDMVKIKTIHGIEDGKLPDDSLSRRLPGKARPSIPPGAAIPPIK
jgi:hypothetical protein